MRAYIGITGVIFGLVTVAHFWRMIVEPHVRTEGAFIALTALSATLSMWAMSLFLRRRPKG